MGLGCGVGGGGRGRGGHWGRVTHSSKHRHKRPHVTLYIISFSPSMKFYKFVCRSIVRQGISGTPAPGQINQGIYIYLLG